MNKKYLLIIFVFIAGMYACNKDATEPAFQGFVQPGYFPAPVYDLSTNTITRQRFELGRKLFYDGILSADNSISCGSCHIQSSAFTQHGHSISHGINDRLGTRNSQPIMNLAWSTSFMWDGGVFNLDLQPIVPITSHEEMDTDVQSVLAKLRNSGTYRSLFKEAYGTDEISTNQFLKALSQFMLMCISSNAKYDSVQRGQATFTAMENEGYNLFKQKCNACHTEPLFTDHSFRNNGLTPSTVNDKGRYMITNNDNDKYKFKVPSLRNLDFTGPYMHDGRLLTIDGVLEHYNAQVLVTPTLDPLLMLSPTPGIHLNTAEKQSMIAFLKTLNDKTFINDKRFAEQ